MSGILDKIKGNVKLIEGDDNVRAQKCLEAVKDICRQYDCMLIPSIMIQGNRLVGINIDGDVGIIAIPRETKNVTPSPGDKK